MNVDVVFQLHSGPQLLSTIVTGCVAAFEYKTFPLLDAWLAVHGGHLVSELGLRDKILLTYYAVKTQLFVYFSAHRKNGGLLKNLIHLVQLWPSILSEC